MIVQDAVYQASRWIGDKTRDYLADSSETSEPTAGELWDKVSPRVDNGLTIYGKMESAPDSTWNPFADSKKSLKKELDEILDALLEVLEMCGAAGYRKRIRSLQVDISTSKSRIGERREQMLSAPTEASLNPIEGLWTGSREGLEDQIADEKDRITEREGQIECLKAAFRKHLQDLGVDVSPKTTDSFLLEVEDGIVSIAAVIANIGRLTEQLQRLVDESGESPSQTKRYYGVYVLLVLAVDRIEKHFISDIDNVFIPKFRRREEKARQNIAVLQKLMSGGRSKELLLGNISASETTINACRVFADTLRDQGRRIADRNIETERTLAEAAITYKTVLLSLDVAELIGQCQAAFRALRELKLPPLRTFQNTQLNDEMRGLATRVVEEE
jgi:hypothetical protein